MYYEIFVRAFSDSNGDGIGDLNGITEKLSYLKSLGVSGIWLTPINPSPSNHGYDVTNYFGINPQFGTMADFERLVKTAHRDGIKVLMDLVINHCSDRNPWFRKAIDPDSPYHDWFVWAGKHADLDALSSVGGKAWHKEGKQYYLGVFNRHMPDLNYHDPALRREMIKVGQFWLKKGVDGFRLDAAKLIDYDFISQSATPNHPTRETFKAGAANPHVRALNVAWWKQFHKAMEKVDPHVFLVGEVWVDHERQMAPYFAGLDSVFNFPIAGDLVRSARQERSADLGKRLHDAMDLFRTYAPGTAVDTPFLANHDQVRVIDQLKGNLSHMRMAAAMLMTLPGRPFMYYGEEIGMQGYEAYSGNRTPMRWKRRQAAAGESTWEKDRLNTSPAVSVAAEKDRSGSLLHLYRTLIHWRKQLPALRGERIAPFAADGGPIAAYVRGGGHVRKLLVVHNLSGSAHDVHLGTSAFGTVIRHVGGSVGLEGRTLHMAPYSTAILN